jgi:ribosomal protein S18 acetylase RimI-like enzyme
MKIRFATPSDAMDIANVHVETWRSTYRGMMPDSLLDNLSLATRGNFWLGYLKKPPEGAFVIVVEDEIGEIAGFANAGPPRPEVQDYDSELYAIYIMEKEQGRGTGRKLVEATARELGRRGTKSMMLWVLKDNEPSRRFYEALGGQLLDEQQFELGEATLVEVGYGWQDISALYGK